MRPDYDALFQDLRKEFAPGALDQMKNPARFVILHLLTILHTMDNLTTIRDMDSPDALDCIKDNKIQQLEQMELLKCIIEGAVNVLRDEEFASFKTDKLLTLFGLLIEIGKRLPIYHAILGDKAAKTALEYNDMLACERVQDILHSQKSGEGRGDRGGKDASEEFKAIVRQKAQALKRIHPTWSRNKAAGELPKDDGIAKHPEMKAKGYSLQAFTDWIKDIFPPRPRRKLYLG